MILAFPDDLKYSIPFNIGTGESTCGPRIGGRAPKKIQPLNLPNCTYFATIPISTSPALEASIFLDWERFMAFDAPTNSITPSGLEFVKVIAHEPTERGLDSQFACPLSEHPLILGKMIVDMEMTEDMEMEYPRSSHKLGGHPHLIQLRENLIKQLEKNQLAGYRHIVQFDYAVPNDAPWNGSSWPFAHGLFHVFGKPPFQKGDWVWLWQY